MLTAIKVSCRNVSTLLKACVNKYCEDGFKWFEDIDEEKVLSQDVSLYDYLEAIEVLDKKEDHIVYVTESGEVDT